MDAMLNTEIERCDGFFRARFAQLAIEKIIDGGDCMGSEKSAHTPGFDVSQKSGTGSYMRFTIEQHIQHYVDIDENLNHPGLLVFPQKMPSVVAGIGGFQNAFEGFQNGR